MEVTSMKKLSLFSLMFIGVVVFALTIPGVVSAQAGETISMTVIDSDTFITVQKTGGGDVLSLYKVRSDRIVLVDTVVNTSNRSNSDTSFPKRYLIRLDVENR